MKKIVTIRKISMIECDNKGEIIFWDTFSTHKEYL